MGEPKLDGPSVREVSTHSWLSRRVLVGGWVGCQALRE